MSKNGVIKRIGYSSTYAFYSDRLYDLTVNAENKIAGILNNLVDFYGCISVKIDNGYKFILFEYDGAYRLAEFRRNKPVGHFDFENALQACTRIATYANENDLYYKAA